MAKKKKMTKADKEHVRDCVENEGFDYCFRDYSDFEDIEDEEFHRLRKAYKDAADALENHIG